MDGARAETEARVAMMGGPVVVLALIGWLAGQSGPDRTAAAADAAWVLVTSGPWAMGWLLAAVGWGRPLRMLLFRGHRHRLALQAGVGVATLMMLDAALGALGALQWGGAIGAWALVVIGLALLIDQLRRHRHAAPVLPILVWTAMPAVAVLLLAACSAPGWLWASEFGGYDALSYHLQLPVEWLALGRIEPLDHNVYSYLPGYMEAAYYHLAVLIGDGIGAVYACQLLHAGLALLTAAVVGRVAADAGGPLAGAVAAVIVLGTPWTVVVGSLGYNEMAVVLFLATGLLVIGDESAGKLGGAATLGVLAAAACGAKLTAAGLVAAPLGLLMLVSTPTRRWPALIVAASFAGLLMLVPWLARNWLYSGNPIFPFATGWFGEGHWSPEQASIWANGHVSQLSPAGRLAEGWHQLFRYGIGPNPHSSEPWRPQWSVLPWLAVAGLVAAALSPSHRRRSQKLAMVLVMQVLFWVLATHIKSRFMLPAVVPAAIAVGIGAAVVRDRLRSTTARRIGAVVAAIAALVWCSLPATIFLRERRGAPAAMTGWTDMITGDRLSPQERVALAETSLTVYLNYVIAPASRTLLVGDATPLLYRGDFAYQTTWDRGPLSEAMGLHPEAPARWLSTLRDEGFTHLLVNRQMLDIWQREGWNDPRLTSERVLDAADRHAELERAFSDDLRLYRLRISD